LMNEKFSSALLEYVDYFEYIELYKERQFQALAEGGAFAEYGEEYYLFICKKSFHGHTGHDVVLFVSNPLSYQSLDITVSIGRPKSHKAQFHMEAAIYFYQAELQSTLKPTGGIKDLYQEYKALAGKQLQEIARTKKEAENFRISKPPEVSCEELPLIETTGGKNYGTEQALTSLAIRKPEPPPPREKQIEARLGICLTIPMERNRSHYNNAATRCFFKPFVIPIKKSGKTAKPKAASATGMEFYRLIAPCQPLKEYMDHFFQLSIKAGTKDASIEAINKIYFQKIARLLLEAPEPGLFQLRQSGCAAEPLQVISIASLELRFSPCHDQKRLEFSLQFTASDGTIHTPGVNFQTIIISQNQVYLFFIKNKQGYLAVPAVQEKFAAVFCFLEEVHSLYPDELKQIRKALSAFQADAFTVIPKPIPYLSVAVQPGPELRLQQGSHWNCIVVQFDYTTRLNAYLDAHPEISLAFCKSDELFQEACINLLRLDDLLEEDQNSGYISHNPHQPETYKFSVKNNDVAGWLVQKGKFYLERGFKIYSEQLNRYIGNPAGSIQIDISHGIKWLEFKPLLTNAEGETLEVGDIDFVAKMVTDKKGDLHLLSVKDIQRLEKLAKYAQQQGGIFRVPSENYFLISELYDKRMEDIPALKETLKAARKMEDFKKIPDYKLAPQFQGTLRTYQTAGFKWLRFLREYGLSGCLADDMGLGKTVQTLALLHTLKAEKKLSASLLVVPVSAIPNWESEIQRFAPKLNFHRHLGSNRAKNCDAMGETDLVITSYATMRNDIAVFSQMEWDYIILDESQNIKNHTAQSTKAVKVLKSKHRLALSGTPIENNTLELWSLFDFLMPGFLGTKQWFQKEWTKPIEKQKDNTKAAFLKKMIFPFILRRKKEEVEKELPAKTEIVESLQMPDDQRKLYIKIAQQYDKEIQREIEKNGFAKSSLKIMEGMLRLRQVCLFPHLVDREYESVSSIKFEHFTEMLEDILKEKHKVLIFSQFVKVLDRLRTHLVDEDIDYSYLDGSVTVRKREKAIKQFQADENTQVFLLSLKAGGVALNLTAADYVIIFDPWWNPSVEAQAVDRSHRIGQTRKVIVYRMVVKDSIEEKMMELQEHKKELVDKLISSDKSAFKQLSKEDILGLFKA
ncbi:MAG: DEAD/DEAH box helicase, partial [bacterium]|nr:DEAD/DEAH box helicase [bacterium]